MASGETLVELETDKVTVEVPAQKAGVLARRLQGRKATWSRWTTCSASWTRRPRAVPLQPQRRQAAPADIRGCPPASSPSAAPPASRPGDAGRRRADASVSRGTASRSRGRAWISRRSRAPGAAASSASRTWSSTWPRRRARAAGTLPRCGAATGSAGSGRSASQGCVSPTPRAVRQPEGEAGARESREKMSTRRRRIAEHLLESQHSTAHLTTFNEIDMTAVEALRGRIKERIEKEHGVRLSMMPFFVKAACMALKQYPGGEREGRRRPHPVSPLREHGDRRRLRCRARRAEREGCRFAEPCSTSRAASSRWPRRHATAS